MWILVEIMKYQLFTILMKLTYLYVKQCVVKYLINMQNLKFMKYMNINVYIYQKQKDP